MQYPGLWPFLSSRYDAHPPLENGQSLGGIKSKTRTFRTDGNCPKFRRDPRTSRPPYRFALSHFETPIANVSRRIPGILTAPPDGRALAENWQFVSAISLEKTY